MGKFIVITGPSAVGKTVLVKTLLSKFPNSTRLVTYTTRQPRPNEKNGIDYFFIPRQDFSKRLDNNDFFEYAEVYGNLYGSSKKKLDELLGKFDYVFAIIDVQGAKTLKTKLPNATVIFISPGSISDIKTRLQKIRKGIPNDELKNRLTKAEYELTLAESFDYSVKNLEGQFETACNKVVELLQKEN